MQSSAAAAFAVFAFSAAGAQTLVDPMRPPPEASAPADSTATAAVSPAPGKLQGVINSPRRKYALVDGALIPLGGPVRDSTLVEVRDGSAVLRKDGEREVLEMYPGIKKTPAKQPGANR